MRPRNMNINFETAFDSGNLMEESRAPEQPFKIKGLHFWNSIQTYDPLPWNIESARNNKPEQASSAKRTPMCKVNFSTLPTRSKMVRRKPKIHEEKPEQFKMNNKFLEFRVIGTAKNDRNKNYQKLEANFEQPNAFEAQIKNRLDNFGKQFPKKLLLTEKSPKMKFLQRKFRLKYTGNQTSRRKSVDNHLNLNKDRQTLFSMTPSSSQTQRIRSNRSKIYPHRNLTFISNHPIQDSPLKLQKQMLSS